MKKTAFKTVRGAFNLLNIDNDDSVLSDNSPFMENALNFTNQILMELRCDIEVKSPTDEIELEIDYFDALIYGIALLYAKLLEDSINYDYLSKLYAQKRASALSRIKTVTDILPKVTAV